MPLSLKKRPELRKSDDLSALIDDVQSLRHDLANVLRRSRSSRFDDVLGSASDIAGRLGLRASGFYKDAARHGVKTFRAVNRNFRDQPVVSMVVAFGIGLLISRLTNGHRR